MSEATRAETAASTPYDLEAHYQEGIGYASTYSIAK